METWLSLLYLKSSGERFYIGRIVMLICVLSVATVHVLFSLTKSGIQLVRSLIRIALWGLMYIPKSFYDTPCTFKSIYKYYIVLYIYTLKTKYSKNIDIKAIKFYGIFSHSSLMLNSVKKWISSKIPITTHELFKSM